MKVSLDSAVTEAKTEVFVLSLAKFHLLCTHLIKPFILRGAF